MLKTAELRSLITRVMKVIVDEAERNEAFAAKLIAAIEIKDAFKKKLHDTAVDPFDVLHDRGEEEFRRWLEGQNIRQLKSIVSSHRLDSSRLSDKWKTKQRFVELILDRVLARSKQGDVFRDYGQKQS